MILYGQYAETRSGRLAPSIEVFLRLSNGVELASLFLIDTGADATFLPAPFLATMGQGTKRQTVIIDPERQLVALLDPAEPYTIGTAS